MTARLPPFSPLGVRMLLAGIAFCSIGLTAAMVYVPWALTSRRNINEVVAQVNEEIERNIAQEVTRLFDNVTTTQTVIRLAVTEGLVDLQNGGSQPAAFFLSLLRANPNFAFVQFAYPSGDYLGAQRVFRPGSPETALFHWHVRRWFADRQTTIKTTEVYLPVGDGLRKIETRQIPEPGWYAPLRPWYQDAVKTPGQPVWTVYVYRSTNTPGLDSNVTLSKDGEFLGVIGVGFELSQISQYLARQNRDRPLGVFIISRNQDLIASMDPAEGAPFQKAGQDTPRLRPLAMTTNPLLAPARQALATRNLDLSQRHRFVYRDPQTGERYFVALSPLHKLDWVVGTVIPEANYRANLDRNNRLLLALVGAFVPLAAIAVVVMADRMVGHPLAALTAAAVKVADGDLAIRVAETAPTREMALLAVTFNRMTAQLERSREELAEYNRTLEQRVAQRTGELQAVLDNLADGLAVISADDRLLQINPALATLLGRQRAAVEGQKASEVFPSPVVDLIVSCRANPSHVYTAEMTVGEDGIGKAVVSAIGMDTPTGEKVYMGAVLSVRDITIEKQIDRMKTDFVSSVSHELRTPLTSILGFAKLIHKKLTETVFPALSTDDKKIQRAVRQVSENIEIVIAEGTRLTKLINDVLDIAKMEAGKLDWRMEPLTVAELVDRALAATSALFEAKGLTAVREVAPDLPGLVGDRDRLIQVMINLISNAVKFQERGSITCRAERDGDFVKISVIDQGVGIAPEDIPKVFEKFKQVGDTLTSKPQGTGLGLPISKEIVEHHQGRLWADSVPGQGSTFWFTLPIPAEAVSLPPTAPKPETAATTVPRVLLVVDDEANIRQLVRQELEPLGYTIREASDGMAAIAQLRTFRPDAILLDLSMPALNGFEVTAILKNAPHSAGIPIVIVSALDEQQRAMALGADGYVTKPIQFEVLIQTLEQAIAARAQHPVVDLQNQPVDLGGLLRLLQAERQVEVPPLVLVVEDDDGVRSLLRQELEGRGYGVREARNGREALAQIAEATPDLITLDILMPEMDGFELARQLKSHPATARIPIAVISVLDRCEGGWRIEADRYFTKPLDVELLAQDVCTLLMEKEHQQRVLVCTDPQDSMGQHLAQTLQNHGFSVDTVQTGEAFAERIRQANPDAIVVDGSFVEYYRKIQAQRLLGPTVSVLVAPEQITPESPAHGAPPAPPSA